jgi:DNA damage-inducible protein 1
MKCGNTFFPISITVLDTDGLDFLLGLDMLRRYRANIDLYRNLLVFHINDTVEEVSFLGEADIPKKDGMGHDEKGAGSSEEFTPDSTSMTELMSLGFSEEQAMDALRKCGGDVQAAAGMLFNNVQG